MSDIIIAGVGQVPVGEHWERSLRDLALEAIQACLRDAGGIRPQALYIGNMLANTVSRQANLGALLVDYAGLEGIEAYTTEASGASGGTAAHLAWMAVSSGFVDTALVVGVEKITDETGAAIETAAAQMLDSDYEAVHGATPTTQAALLMQRYLHAYPQAPRSAFGGFALTGHANAVHNPNALFRKAITQGSYERAETLSDPLNLYDVAPYADGAAAILLTRSELLPAETPHPGVRISGSSVATDTLALHDRRDPLAFDAARLSVEGACRQAGMLPSDADLFEVFDSYSIYGLLSLEAAGLAAPGEGWKLAQNGGMGLHGKVPVSTFGGLKARGNPIGATGVYQLVEAVLQLRGQAGEIQVPGAQRALVQSLGGPASTAVTHVLTI